MSPEAQYRFVVFYSNSEQKRIAEAYIKQLDQAKVFHSPIVTQVVELKAFYPAEEHHQNFCNRHPQNPYLLNVAMPKEEKIKKQVSKWRSSSNQSAAALLRPRFWHKPH